MSLFQDKAKIYIPKLMLALDITRIQACGIFGNLGTETGGFLHLQELKPTVKGSKGGYGWMQWTGPRRRKYEAWCKANNMEPSSDDANYTYLVHETLTDEKHSLIQLRKTTTIEAATETFMAQNLRPGVPHLDNRIKYARIADEATRAPVEEATGAAVIVAGGAAVAAANPVHWHWYLIGAIVAAGVAWIMINSAKGMNEEEQPPMVDTKKGKTNGKKDN
jgi:hypothetical protein